MKIVNENLESVPLANLKLHPKNPRQGDVRAIRGSIQANGWYGAIVAQRSTGVILAGNHRYLAARDAGAREVPVVWVEVDDATADRILLADNRTNDLADYDKSKLAGLLLDVLQADRSLAGTGYKFADLDKLIKDDALDPLVDGEADDQSGLLPTGFQILVECTSEEQQSELLLRLTAEGYECRALIA